MQRLKSVTLAPVDADPNGIAESQTPAAGGVQALDLDGDLVTDGVAVMDIPRRVGITSDGADSGRTFTISGTDRYGRPLVETLVGPATATVSSLNDFATVTSITVDDDTAGAITAGTSGVASSQWFPVDRIGMKSLGIGVKQTGTANWKIERTYQDPFTPGVGVLPAGGVPNFYLQPFDHPTLVNKSASADAIDADEAVTAVRLTVNTFTAPASITADFAPGFAR